MAEPAYAPILITGGARRIGLALCKALLKQNIPLIISYRHEYPAIKQLVSTNVQCIQADFSDPQSIYRFAEQVKQLTPKLRAIIHNASLWEPENKSTPLEVTLQNMIQVHVTTPYLLNHVLYSCLKTPEIAGSDIIHFTDYVVEKGSQQHIAYAASKAALDNMTRSFAKKFSPYIKVNSIAPALLMFNDEDTPDYKAKALEKSLMNIVPGAQEAVEAVNYLLKSKYVTGSTLHLSGGRALL